MDRVGSQFTTSLLLQESSQLKGRDLLTGRSVGYFLMSLHVLLFPHGPRHAEIPNPALRPPHETGHPKAPGNGRRRGRCIGGAGSAGGVHVGEPKIPLPATEEGRAGDQLRPGVNWRSSDHDGTTRKMDPNHQYSRGRASGSVAT